MIIILQNEHGMMKSNDCLEEENGSWPVIETVGILLEHLQEMLIMWRTEEREKLQNGIVLCSGESFTSCCLLAW